jgi:hypothetical protein
MAKIESKAEVDIVTTGKNDNKTHDTPPTRHKNVGELLFKVKYPQDHEHVIKSLIQKNSDIFAASDLELGQTNTITMQIDTGGSEPIKLNPYFTPLKDRPIVEKTLKDIQKAGIIEQFTKSLCLTNCSCFET